MFHLSLLLPLLLFCIVSFYTPGPNNLMLMTSGLNFGMRRTLPAAMGVAFGFAFLELCVGLGLGMLFAKYPPLYMFLKYTGGLYLLYLAYKIAKSKPPTEEDLKQKQSKKPFGFLQAAAFQWVNPKGWAMAIGAVATYNGIALYPYNIGFLAIIFVFIGMGSASFWAALGHYLQRFLHKPKLIRAFNYIMALLLVASLYPILLDATK